MNKREYSMFNKFRAVADPGVKAIGAIAVRKKVGFWLDVS